tara:strand:+ start:38976 stop:39212 length:237 start_codon:yes stop_codon:yes gene_type:complete
MGNRPNANTMKAIVDMAHALSGSFKRYSISTRQKAWKSLSSSKGDKEVAKLIRNPNRPINTFQQLAFREWLEVDSTNA